MNLEIFKQLYLNREAMKVRLYRVLACMLVMLPGMHHCFCTQGESPREPDNPGAFEGVHRPCDSIVSDLLDFLPGYMEEKHIPGCAIALIHDHGIAWSMGFGVLNTITRKPVERETVFEVASNSKIVTAAVALLLVEQGKLALDTPLNSYLATPWLPDTPYREAITLRHVLTHTSGLGHNNMSREVLFPPGTGYQYSNLGFNYLQHVMEEISGKPLEALASTLVFEPAGMEYTSYINKKSLRRKLANGHVPGSYLLGLSGTFFGVSLLLIWVPGLLIHRVSRKRWLPKKRTVFHGLLLTVITVAADHLWFLWDGGLAEIRLADRPVWPGIPIPGPVDVSGRKGPVPSPPRFARQQNQGPSGCLAACCSLRPGVDHTGDPKHSRAQMACHPGHGARFPSHHSSGYGPFPAGDFQTGPWGCSVVSAHDGSPGKLAPPDLMGAGRGYFPRSPG